MTQNKKIDVRRSGGGGSFVEPVVFTEDVVGKNFIKTRSGTIARNLDGSVASVTLIGGRTIVIHRTEGVVSSITDGTRTWTLSRDGDGRVTGWAVT
jgi:YD repeat-containing protein